MKGSGKMKGISIATGALIALGLSTAPAVYAADDDLEHVTLDFVLDDHDDVDGVILALEEHDESQNDERENREDGDVNDDHQVTDEEQHLAELGNDEREFERDGQSEDGIEDHDVEEEVAHDEMPNDGEEVITDEIIDEVTDELVDEITDEEIALDTDGETV